MTDNAPMKVRPLHLILAVSALGGLLLLADRFLAGGFEAEAYERVAPKADGTVRLDLSALAVSEVSFYRFLNRGNQEVRFFVGRDPQGTVQVAFDANEQCAKTKRGYRHQGEWVVCNKCDKAFRITEVNAGGGGCKPITLEHRLNGNQLLLAESDILKGWRYFN